MGLDTTHDCFHGPYSSFYRLRNAWAVAGGIGLRTDANPSFPADLPNLDGSLFTSDHLWGRWRKPPDDPLVVVLVHYDTEGFLPAKVLRPLAKRLKGLLQALPPDPQGYHGVRAQTERFIKGLQRAARKKQRVEFH